MIKNVKTAVFFLVQILFLQGIYCQVPLNVTDQLKQKFINYTGSVYREEIYIHSDREEYISGEDLWFNVYLIDRKTLAASSDSKIAYFELLNQENRPIVQKRIWLDGGYGPGQINLPDTLSTGIYKIRAYTSWMKNFFPYNCFAKDVFIYNAFSNKSIKVGQNAGSPVSIGIPVQTPHATTNNGLTLIVDNLKPGMLEILVLTDETYRSQNNNVFYLFIQTHGNIDHISTEMLTGETTTLSVSKDQLSAGINQITVFNSKGQPLSERYIYTPEKYQPSISVQSSDSSDRRSKLSFALNFGKGPVTTTGSSKFSVSVAPYTRNNPIPGLDDYLVFGTEFGSLRFGKSVNWKIRARDPEVMDSLCSTLKSNWTDWSLILAGRQERFKYPAEKEYHFLSGRLLRNDLQSSDSINYILLSVPGKNAFFQYCKTDKEGNFSFRIHIDEKINDLILQPDVVVKNQAININSPFSDQYVKSEVIVDSVDNSIPQYISEWSVNHQVRKIYGISSVGEPVIPVIAKPEIKRFYGKPDQELNMKDYIVLPVMQEVFFELLVGVIMKVKKTGYEIKMADPQDNKLFDNPPGLFIDGVVVRDPSMIAAIDPELVERIDVIRNKYFVGDYLLYGIVNVITKTADFINATLPDYAVRLHYRTIDPGSAFVSPEYSSAEMLKSRIPDFRNTLYWNPSLKPDKDGKAFFEFWTSDYESGFDVIIQGFTPEGKAFSLKKTIKVK